MSRPPSPSRTQSPARPWPPPRASGQGDGDHDVADLYRRYGATVLRRASRFLPAAEAEELMHEVFLKLLENPASFRGESSPATWLYRVTTRLCIDRMRVQSGRNALIAKNARWLTPQCDPGTLPEARVFLASLWQTLDEELAMIGMLYYIDGLTTAEIGRMLGVSDRTIASRLTALTNAAKLAAGEGSP